MDFDEERVYYIHPAARRKFAEAESGFRPHATTDKFNAADRNSAVERSVQPRSVCVGSAPLDRLRPHDRCGISGHVDCQSMVSEVTPLMLALQKAAWPKSPSPRTSGYCRL
jgi:hypothetical protein